MFRIIAHYNKVGSDEVEDNQRWWQTKYLPDSILPVPGELCFLGEAYAVKG